MSTAIRKIGRLFLFVASGLAVIIVGFFMLRGTMSMWDRPDDHGDPADGTPGGRGDGGGGKND